MEIIKKFRSEVSIISNDNFLDNSGLEKNEISNTSFNGADSNDSISKSSFILSDLHSSLKDFLKSLSGEELLAFGGLLLNGLIVNYTVNIIFILYGDYLIKKFNLESKNFSIEFLMIERRWWEETKRARTLGACSRSVSACHEIILINRACPLTHSYQHSYLRR